MLLKISATTTAGLAASLFCLLALAATPTSSEVKHALETRLNKDLVKTFAGNTRFIAERVKPAVRVNSVDNCKPVTDEIVECLVNSTVTMLNKSKSAFTKYRFKQSPEGEWHAVL